MQYDSKHLLNFVFIIGLEWLNLGENRTSGSQIHNNGVLETPMSAMFL